MEAWAVDDFFFILAQSLYAQLLEKGKKKLINFVAKSKA